MAREAEKTPAQVALKWVMQNPVVTSPIIGVRTMEQLENNLGAIGWSLSVQQMERLNQASELLVSYPYDVAAEDQQRRGR